MRADVTVRGVTIRVYTTHTSSEDAGVRRVQIRQLVGDIRRESSRGRGS